SRLPLRGCTCSESWETEIGAEFRFGTCTIFLHEHAERTAPPADHRRKGFLGKRCQRAARADRSRVRIHRRKARDLKLEFRSNAGQVFLTHPATKRHPNRAEQKTARALVRQPDCAQCVSRNCSARNIELGSWRIYSIP